VTTDEILTVYKASRFCHVSSKTIINWIESGHINAYKTVGGHRRIKRVDLEAFMKKQGIPLPEDAPVISAYQTNGLFFPATPFLDYNHR